MARGIEPCARSPWWQQGGIALHRPVASGDDIATGDVVIGVTLADNLGVGVGDRLRVTSSEGIDDNVTINGPFRVGNDGVHRTWVLTSLRHAQSLYVLPRGANAIELKVADIFAAEDVARDLHDSNGARRRELDEAERGAAEWALRTKQLEVAADVFGIDHMRGRHGARGRPNPER